MLSNLKGNTTFLITKHTNYQALPIKIQKHPIKPRRKNSSNKVVEKNRQKNRQKNSSF